MNAVAYFPKPLPTDSPPATESASPPTPATPSPTALAYQALVSFAVASCVSPNTRRVYAARLQAYFASGYPLTRDGVLAYLNQLRVTELIKAPTYNGILSAIKKLVAEAELRDIMSPLDARSITNIRTIKLTGIRAGNWLTLAGSQQLRALPNRRTQRGKRDACIIALLLGCGLRRDEASRLTWRHWQSRDGRMCLVDILGKGGRIRTIPVPEWARIDISAWAETLSPYGRCGPDAPVLYRMRCTLASHKVIGESRLTAHGLWSVVSKYAAKMDMPKLSPHDLRRTLARLMKKAGAGWDQIQYTLGHAKIETTQLYVGSLELDEGAAGVDLIKW